MQGSGCEDAIGRLQEWECASTSRNLLAELGAHESLVRQYADPSQIETVSVPAGADGRVHANAEQMLEPFGVDVHAVGSPVKALEMFTREKADFHLVLLDYYMPQLDGAKTFEWLKKLNPNVKVIIVSGIEELRLRQTLARPAIDGYIRKPFRIQEALEVIRHVMTKTGAKPVAH